MTNKEKIAKAEQRIEELKLLIRYWKKQEEKQIAKTNKENEAFITELPPILNAKEYKAVKDEILD